MERWEMMHIDDGSIGRRSSLRVPKYIQVVLALQMPFKPGNQQSIDDHNHRQADIVHLISDQVKVMLVT